MFKIFDYFKYKKNLRFLNKNYIAVFCIYKGIQLCDPVEIYRKDKNRRG